MMNEWTREERLTIKRLHRALKSLPASARLYVTDDELIVCKQGVPSDALRGMLDGHRSNRGCVLTDMHDENEQAMEPLPAPLTAWRAGE